MERDIHAELLEWQNHELPLILESLDLGLKLPDDPRSRGVLTLAFCHGSFLRTKRARDVAMNFLYTRSATYQRLEFYGDLVLKKVLGGALLHDDEEPRSEHELTECKSHLESNRNCAAVMRGAGLERHVLVGAHLAQSGPLPDKLCADVLESFIGAVEEVYGHAQAERLVRKLFFGHEDAPAPRRPEPRRAPAPTPEPPSPEPGTTPLGVELEGHLARARAAQGLPPPPRRRRTAGDWRRTSEGTLIPYTAEDLSDDGVLALAPSAAAAGPSSSSSEGSPAPAPSPLEAPPVTLKLACVCRRHGRRAMRVAGSWRRQGNAHFIVGQWQRAVDAYARAVELDPTCAFSHALRSIARLRAGDVGGALCDARRAVTLDPEYAKAYVRLGEAHLVRQEWKEAATAFARSLEVAALSPRRCPACNRKLPEAKSGGGGGGGGGYRAAGRASSSSRNGHVSGPASIPERGAGGGAARRRAKAKTGAGSNGPSS